MTTNTCFLSHLTHFSLEWGTFQTKVVQQNHNTHFMFKNPLFFKISAFYEITWKVRNACWIPKAKATRSEYVIITAFPRTRLNVTLYVQRLPFFTSFHTIENKKHRHRSLMCIGPCIILITEEYNPTRCHLLLSYAYVRLNMFRAPLCPSSGAHDDSGGVGRMDECPDRRL